MYLFGFCIFGFFVVVVVVVFVFVLGLCYFKIGLMELGVYCDMMCICFYLGMDLVDSVFDIFYYDQIVFVVVLIVCFVFVVGFILVFVVLCDILFIKCLCWKLMWILVSDEGFVVFFV